MGFTSLVQASHKFSLSITTIGFRSDHPNQTNYNRLEGKAKKHKSHKTVKPPKAKPVYADGVIYDNILEAASALNVGRATAKRRASNPKFKNCRFIN